MRMGWRREAPRKFAIFKGRVSSGAHRMGLDEHFFGVIMRMGTGAADIFDFYRKSFVQVFSKQIPWYP